MNDERIAWLENQAHNVENIVAAYGSMPDAATFCREEAAWHNMNPNAEGIGMGVDIADELDLAADYFDACNRVRLDHMPHHFGGMCDLDGFVDADYDIDRDYRQGGSVRAMRVA